MPLPLLGFAIGTRAVGLGFSASGLGARRSAADLPFNVELDVKRFNRQVAEFTENRFPRAYVALVATQAREALRGLHKRTPIGMPETWKRGRAPAGYVPGNAKGNWQVTTGSPPSQPVFRSDPISAGLATIASWERRNSGRARSMTALVARMENLHVANLAPYIERLEHGWSDQAPAGMLSLTVREMEASL